MTVGPATGNGGPEAAVAGAVDHQADDLIGGVCRCADAHGMSDDYGPVPEHLRPALEDVVRRLPAGDTEGLVRDGHVMYPDADLLIWVREYGDDGATLVPLPPEAWQDGEAVATEQGDGEWSV